ncbi:MAG: tRNA pseudouridine(38-40) synthase TruA [SAR202 cluster bacterium]|nr:tRNA pseudouridine(38-40) synthase TruA [SAR202 cluster bacterium]
MRVALVVEYDGTEYHGFQYQENAPSIQAELESAIEKLTKEKVRIKGAGRTDTGVHATGQVIAFDTNSTLPIGTLVSGLNHYLPEDIAIRGAYGAPEGFDPRRDALSRRYRYTIHNTATRSPMSRRTALLIDEPLDVAAMDGAARRFEGVHDFARFAGSLEDGEASTVRRIDSASVWKEGDTVYFEVTGNAFLPHQVRRMAGALVDVGKGRLTGTDIGEMLEGTAGNVVANTLPPQGLCLMEVTYEDFPPKNGEGYDTTSKVVQNTGI